MENQEFVKAVENIRDHASVVDLSYTMEPNMPFWPTQPQYSASVVETYEEGGESFHQEIHISEHTGTHMDAPKHFIPGSCSVDRLNPTTVMGRGVTLHAENIPPRGLLDVEQIITFEREHGPILAGDIVMIRFGWDDRYAILPEDKGFLRDWPGLSDRAAQYLADKKVAAVGCDTLALDAFECSQFVSHQILLGAGIPIIENICNLQLLPPFCAVIGLWNKFKDGSGSPIRLLALL